jgi:glycosyltransferase involved in cell wall biosynthesis
MSCLPEIVGGAAITIEPTATEIKKAILLIAHNRLTRESMVAKGIKRAAMFKWESCFLETVAFYDNILNV